MSIIEKLLAIVNHEIGVRETGKNVGARIAQYQGATWLKPGPWPWCCAFVAFCIREWLRDFEVQAALHLSDDETKSWRCLDANVDAWIAWGKRRGLKMFDETQLAKAGDIVVFDFGHIGFVVKDQVPGSGFIATVEGNTGPNKGEVSDGVIDGVYRRTRAVSLVRTYIRIVQ